MSDLVLVAIGGPLSSGKSTCANALHSLFPESTLVHQDDFYLPDSQIPVDGNTQLQNWDGVDAIDFARFHRFLVELRHGGPLQHDAPSLEMDAQLKLTAAEMAQLRLQGAPMMHGKCVVLVDGFMLFHDPTLVDLFDVKLLFHAPYAVLKHRRENRPGYLTAEGFWEDPPGYFDKIVWPEYEKTHRYLFEEGDVNSNLNARAAELGIRGICNENRLLYSLVEEALQLIGGEKAGDKMGDKQRVD